MAAINFFSEDIPFKIPHPRKTSNWLKSAIKTEKRNLEALNFIFCSDKHLLEINVQYLNHKTLTDIITFDQSEDAKSIHGDIFISIERVRENAEKFRTSFDDELHRVLIHGVLHLCGYSDKSKNAKLLMREKEDAYLSLR